MTTCDNALISATRIISPPCWSSPATCTLIVDYAGEKDVLELCEACADVVTKDARRHGYTVRRINYK